MNRDLHFEVVYAHARDKVWAALIDVRALECWLMPNDFVPVVGHRFTFCAAPAPGFDGTIACRVLEVAPPERLVYTWSGAGIETKVIWTLEDDGERTRLSLDHAGFGGSHGPMMCRIIGKDWRAQILRTRLPTLLESWSGSGPIPAPRALCHRDVAASVRKVTDHATGS